MNEACPDCGELHGEHRIGCKILATFLEKRREVQWEQLARIEALKAEQDKRQAVKPSTEPEGSTDGR